MLLKDIENYAKENNIPIMLLDGIEFLTNYIKDNNIKTILEIGTAIGYSAIKMSLVSNDIQITTIERDENRYQEAIKNINSFKLNKQIKVIKADALEIDLHLKYDLIFIDAAKSQNIKFFELFQSNLNNRGVIITDNLNFHGLVRGSHANLSKNVKGLVKKINDYIEYLENNQKFITTFYNLGDGISISVLKEN